MYGTAPNCLPREILQARCMSFLPCVMCSYLQQKHVARNPCMLTRGKKYMHVACNVTYGKKSGVVP
jgi:hypothetical protein